MKFLIVIYCVGLVLGMVASDKKVDLKSILLQILNQEKIESQSNTQENNLDNIKNSEADIEDKTSVPNANITHNSPEQDDDQKCIIKDATKEIVDEIERLKTKFNKNGNKMKYDKSDDDNNEVVKTKDSESSINNGGNQDEEYDLLVVKLNEAAKELLLLRSELAVDFVTDEEDLQRYAEDHSTRPKKTEKLSNVNRLLEILHGIEFYLQKDKTPKKEKEMTLDHDEDMFKLIALETLHSKNQIGNKITGNGSAMQTKFNSNNRLSGEGLENPGLSERDWHDKSCSEFRDPCLGWFQDCCESGKIGTFSFKMCCSFSNFNFKNKDKLSGICIPNAYGSGKCVQRRP